jgi:uncharacterized membrane protein YhaH (DUF805 family)
MISVELKVYNSQQSEFKQKSRTGRQNFWSEIWFWIEKIIIQQNLLDFKMQN